MSAAPEIGRCRSCEARAELVAEGRCGPCAAARVAHEDRRSAYRRGVEERRAARAATPVAATPMAIDWSAQPLGLERDAAIAARLGVSGSRVFYARKRRGIPSFTKGRALIDMRTPYADDDRCWYVVEAHPDGLTLDEIGQLMGVTREWVRQIEERALEHLRARCELAGISREDVREFLARRER